MKERKDERKEERKVERKEGRKRIKEAKARREYENIRIVGCKDCEF